MNLRSRLALTVALTAIPLVAGLAWLRHDIEERSAQGRLREVAETWMDGRAWEDHARAPASFGGHLESRAGRGQRRQPGGRALEGEPRRRGPPPRRGVGPEGPLDPAGERPPPPLRRPRRPLHDTWVWLYDASFRSANPAAPAFPAALRAAVAAGDEAAGSAYENEERTGHQLALRVVSPGGETAFVLVQRLGSPEGSAVPGIVWGSLVLCGVLVLAVLLAAAPIVRRVRTLTRQVGRSAGEHYAVPVQVSGRDEIAGLARAFNEAGARVREHVEDLERREQTLRGFVANTTHDVMTPLTVLQGHLSGMRKRLAQGDRVSPESVTSSLEEAHYMGSLLHNLSAVAKLEAGAGSLQRHAVDLNAIVERAVSRHRPMAGARQIQMDYAVPEAVVEVLADVTLLEQAVSNLVQNAVRYNDPGGHVAVLLEAGREAGRGIGTFSLRVLDDGPGMPDEELARLPERRYRGDAARSRNPEGLGLGLSIAWDVAERHGLTLQFRASEYGGLEAELSGPCVPDPARAEPDPGSTA